MTKIYLSILATILTTGSLAQWTNQTAVNTPVSSSRTGDAKSIGTSDGKTFVAYWKDVPAPAYFEMRLQLLDAQGNQLFGPDGMLVNNVVTMSSSTQIWNISIDAQDNVYIAFNGTSGTNPVYVHKINTTGTQLWGASGVNPSNGFIPQVLPLSNGEVVISWLPTSGNQSFFQKFSAAGTAVWGAPKIITPSIGSHRTSAGEMAALSNGGFEILFHDRATASISSNFWAQRYDNDGNTQWAAPLQLSNKTTSYNRHYSMVQSNDTVFLGYFASTGSRFDSYLQRINPDGTIPWGINGSDFDNGNVYYETETSIAYQPGSSFVWSVCTYTNSSQGIHGETVQKFDALSGLRQFTDNAKILFPISSNDTAHKGSLQLINDAPFFMLSGGTNNGASPINMIATRLDANGNFAWAPTTIEMGTYSNTKGRYEFTRPYNNQSVGVWTETRTDVNESRVFAQNITAGAVIGPIPVRLGDFYGRLNGKTIKLYWQTYTELNNKGFYIERAATGTDFSSIGFVASKAPGGSNLLLNYDFTDAGALNGNNFYRLKQVDLDGKASYSNIILLKQNIASKGLLIYPNPAQNYVLIEPAGKINDRFIYNIINEAGAAVAENSFILKQKDEAVKIDIAKLPAGNYRLRLLNQTGSEILQAAFIKSKQ